MQNNNLKLFLLSILMIIVGGYLVVSGVKDSDFNFIPFQPKITPAPTVYPANQLPDFQESKPDDANAQFSQVAFVTKVIDGDTIDVEIDDKQYRLRYVGINTPETVDPRKGVECFGKEASNKNKELVEGKKVYLKKDISETDRYNRLLRLVYLQVDQENFLFVNDYLVREGYAQASTFPPDVTFSEQLKEAEKQARDAGKGLWGKCRI